MTEKNVAAGGYFLVHSCEPGSFDHEDDCNGVFVWAPSPEAAVAVAEARAHMEEPLAERIETVDSHRALLGDFWGSGFGPSGPAVDKALRAAMFHEGNTTSCEPCGLYEFGSLPESKVCDECLRCAECGHDAECKDVARLREELA